MKPVVIELLKREAEMKLSPKLSVFIILVCIVGVFAEDWPRWRGPDYNGISKETGFRMNWSEESPRILWEKSIGIGFSSITVSNGKAYTMGNINEREYIYCFDAVTGEEIWEHSYPCPLFADLHEGGPGATPTVDGDMVYTFGRKGDIIRFDAATGDVIWQKNVEDDFDCEHPRWYFSSSPFIVDDLVILNAGTRGLALNKANGSVKWQNGTGAGGYSTPVPFDFNGRKSIAMLVAKEFIGLDIETGKVLWQVPWTTRADMNIADVVISGSKMFISSSYGAGCALYNVESGKPEEIYRNQDMGNEINACVLWEGYLYGFDGLVELYGGIGRGSLRCMDFETGKVVWSQDGLGVSSLMLADGKLIILTEDGKLVLAEAIPEGYRELASSQILTYKCWTVPVLANGKIYARNAQGKLVCVDISNTD